jgi:D-glycero-D-manno-heptose 1,7-bisphosphate phosphatase
MPKRAVFLDLNGTLVAPVQADSPEQYDDIESSLEAVRRLSIAGFVCPVVTVQSRVGKGVYSAERFLEWFAAFQSRWRDAGTVLLGPYLCPHRFNSGCACAKPKPFLYLEASRQHGIDCSQSFVVGDTASDVDAAIAIGAKGCLVLTGWGNSATHECAGTAWFVGEDLASVADRILQQPKIRDSSRGGHARE